jgi:hypothetical protein
MNFFVNGQEVDVTIEDEKTIGDILRSFELTCEKNDAAVIGITVDDKKITAETFDTVELYPLKKDSTFSFDVITKQAVSDSFHKLSTIFTELAVRMEQIPVNLQSGKDKEVRTAIATLADNIEDFCHTAMLSSLFPDTFKTILINGKQFSEFFSDFSPILLDFEDALKSNDTVQIGDLSEYEICPRLRAIADSIRGVS